MKALKFFEMSTEELTQKLNEKKAELFNLRFQHATNQLESPAKLTECRHDIAKIKTILRQRELGLSVEPQVTKKKGSRK
ncbi:MAG: 50S ribosomal protein L29 [Clostridia bacterium]|nr:50S ribosomal protein L29 [Clostridia bacterium]